MQTDQRCLACNYREGTKIVAKGSIAFVVLLNRGNGSERIKLRVRSRHGNWIEKWEAIGRLTNFRFKTIPASHPLYKEDIELFVDEGIAKALTALGGRHELRIMLNSQKEPGCLLTGLD